MKTGSQLTAVLTIVILFASCPMQLYALQKSNDACKYRASVVNFDSLESIQESTNLRDAYLPISHLPGAMLNLRSSAALNIAYIKSDEGAFRTKKDSMCDDLIILTTGEEFFCTVKMINDKEVSYHTCDKSDRGNGKEEITNIFMIKYGNGSTEVFGSSQKEKEDKVKEKFTEEVDMEIPTRPEKTYPQNVDIIVYQNGTARYCKINKITENRIYFRVYQFGKDFSDLAELDHVSKIIWNGKVAKVSVLPGKR